MLYIPKEHRHEGYTDEETHSVSLSLTNPFSEEDMKATTHSISQLHTARTRSFRMIPPAPLPSTAIQRVRNLEWSLIPRNLAIVTLRVMRRQIAELIKRDQDNVLREFPLPKGLQL